MTTRPRLVAGLIALGMVAAAPSADDKDAKANAAGTWTWTFKRQDGEEVTSTLKLKQEGEKLTGTMTAFGSDTDIKEGKAEKDGAVAFQVVREFGGNEVTIKYKGKVEGDTMKLKAEFERDGEVRTREFEAKRTKPEA